MSPRGAHKVLTGHNLVIIKNHMRSRKESSLADEADYFCVIYESIIIE